MSCLLYSKVYSTCKSCCGDECGAGGVCLLNATNQLFLTKHQLSYMGPAERRGLQGQGATRRRLYRALLMLWPSGFEWL